MLSMKLGNVPSLEAPVTATVCVLMYWVPSLLLTSAVRMKRANSSAQFACSELLM